MVNDQGWMCVLSLGKAQNRVWGMKMVVLNKVERQVSKPIFYQIADDLKWKDTKNTKLKELSILSVKKSYSRLSVKYVIELVSKSYIGLKIKIGKLYRIKSKMT